MGDVIQLPNKCEVCGTAIEQPPKGARRKYCTPRCRTIAHRKRLGTPITGRPPDAERRKWREACRAHNPEIIKYLVGLANGEFPDASHAERTKAAVFLYEQGNGRAIAATPEPEDAGREPLTAIEIGEVDADGSRRITDFVQLVNGKRVGRSDSV